jgi:hypothetical protein
MHKHASVESDTHACLCRVTHKHASVESNTRAFHTAHAGVDVSERACRFYCRVWSLSVVLSLSTSSLRA